MFDSAAAAMDLPQTANGNFHLTAASGALINAGNGGSCCPSHDIDGDERHMMHPDMGADEF